MSSLPRRFMLPRLLLVGCGDVGLRVLRLLRGRYRLYALTSSVDRFGILRAAGAVPVLGDLDEPRSLTRLAGLADAALHLAPPAPSGMTDPRTSSLLQALARRGRVRRLVYVSTTGVYGDAQGACFDETRAVNPGTERAQRRVDAEQKLRWFGRGFGARVVILRAPGIYANDRISGHPRERLLRGTPVWVNEEDAYSNHIHADDMARICVAALHRGMPQRVVHACDDTELKRGDYFDRLADLFDLPRPPRITRAEAMAQLTPVQRSFMSESRRLCNRRLKQELRFKLRYPTVREGWLAEPSHALAQRLDRRLNGG